MSDVPMPEAVEVPLDVVRALSSSVDDALRVLPPGSPEAVALDAAIGQLARIVLRAMGLHDGEA